MATSVGLFWVARWRSPVALLAIPIAALIALPWLVATIAAHGLEPFLWAAQSRSGGFDDTVPREVAAWLIQPNPIVIAGAVGMIATLWRRSWLFPTWAILMFLLPGAAARWIAVPWAFFAATAVLALAQRDVIRVPIGAIGLGTAIVAISQFGHALPSSDRDAMRRVAQDYPNSVTFAAIGDANFTEWFPYLARHASRTTLVGLEWTPEGPSGERLAEVRELQACTSRECILDWAAANGADHVLFQGEPSPVPASVDQTE